jgi:hypothetical protein
MSITTLDFFCANAGAVAIDIAATDTSNPNQTCLNIL